MKTKALARPYSFKKFKTYYPEEILAAGGTSAFGKLTAYDPKKLYKIKGEALTDEEFKKAIKMLSK
jgi:hypothetical protein